MPTKKRIFDKIIGFCTCSQAHPRSLAQYFVLKTLENDKTFQTYVNVEGLDSVLSFMKESKDTQTIYGKFAKEMQKREAHLFDQSGATGMLAT